MIVFFSLSGFSQCLRNVLDTSVACGLVLLSLLEWLAACTGKAFLSGGSKVGIREPRTLRRLGSEGTGMNDKQIIHLYGNCVYV
ncbi:hypothetical protein F4809DRAFT_617937 [Biscogniauxia mediterranea]|nr:hypothetical protein F4809DRAFT_617937 [Biscogniauxia mediterranea]